MSGGGTKTFYLMLQSRFSRTFAVLAVAAFALFAFAPSANAQFLQSLANKAKEKAKEKIEQKVEDTVDKTMDKVLNNDKSGEKNNQGNQNASKNNANDNNQGAKDNTPEAATGTQQKSDFVPGAVTLFEDKVVGEQVGEFPSKWNLREGLCEVSKLGGETVISLPPATIQDESVNSEIQPLMKNIFNYLPEEYTIEFDWYVYAKEDDCNEFSIYCCSEEDKGNNDYQLAIRIEEDPQFQGTSRFFFTNTLTGENREVDATFKVKKNAWNHVAISFNKRALKAYINDYRIANIPNAKSGTFIFLQSIARYLGNGILNKKGTQFKNFRIAKGAVALYDQNTTDAVAKAMAETGKFVTNNILFETGKADLKAESMAEIQKVAEYMKKNPNVRFEVQGHTDNQGSDKINDPLSQKRAEAIVAALVNLGVDEWNLRAVGKGSHEPVADNGTEAGRAKNRRVEFIKR